MIRIAKVVWIVLVALGLSLYILGGVVYFNELDRVCVRPQPECHARQLATLEDVAHLQNEGLTLQDWAIATSVNRAIVFFIYCVAGFVIFARKHNQWTGLVFSYLLIASGTIGVNYSALVAGYPGLTLPAEVTSYLGYISFALFLAIFPSGHVVPRIMWIPIALWCIFFFLDQFFDLPPNSSPLHDQLILVGWFGLFSTGLSAQVYRYLRRSNDEQRRQTKWVLFGITILVLSIAALYLTPPTRELGNPPVYSRAYLLVTILLNFLVTLIPITIGVAILRSHLFDIDVIIRRTLTYALVTVLLGLVFFSSVIILEQIFARTTGSGQNEIVTVLSTLAIAALFVPLRNRVQTLIDRHFNRNKYNAQLVLADFANTVRDETDLEKLTARLMQVVDETMQPKSVSLWLKEAEWEKRAK